MLLSTSNIVLTAAALTWTTIAPVTGLPQYSRDAPYQPLMPDNFADPAIITVDDAIWTFATNSAGVNIPIATNSTGDGWHILQTPSGQPQDALPNLPPWCSGNVWAPDVVQLPSGSFVLYFSGSLTAPNTQYHCVGAATSDSVTGPYTALPTPLACDTTKGGAIDPFGFTDSDNTPYVVYKDDGNTLSAPNNGICGNADGSHATPLMIQKLAPDYVTPVGDPVELLNRDAGDGPLIEAPSLLKSVEGVYVLSFSSNCFNSPDYDTSYATSENLLGPYTKTTTPLLKSGEHGLMSPGGTSFSKDGSTIVFHADEKYSDASVRQMYLKSVSVSGTTVELV